MIIIMMIMVIFMMRMILVTMITIMMTRIMMMMIRGRRNNLIIRKPHRQAKINSRGSTTKLVLPWFPTVVEQVLQFSNLNRNRIFHGFSQDYKSSLCRHITGFSQAFHRIRILPFAGTCPTIEAPVRVGGQRVEQGRLEPGRPEQEGRVEPASKLGGEQEPLRGRQEGLGRVELGGSEQEGGLRLQPIPAGCSCRAQRVQVNLANGGGVHAGVW